MSVRILSHAESEASYRKTFSELRERTVFTYQDEAGVHLCIVKQRIEEQTLQVVKISDPNTIEALCTGIGEILFHVYEFNSNHCLNILKLANREPLEHEVKSTMDRQRLETYYSENKDRIWRADPERDLRDSVMLRQEGETIIMTYFNMGVLDSWPDRPETFILKNRSQ